MDRSIANYLIEHENLLNHIPLPLDAVICDLESIGLAPAERVRIAFRDLARRLPHIVVIETEGNSEFLSFFQPQYLRKWLQPLSPMDARERVLCPLDKVTDKVLYPEYQKLDKNNFVCAFFKELDPPPCVNSLKLDFIAELEQPSEFERLVQKIKISQYSDTTYIPLGGIEESNGCNSNPTALNCDSSIRFEKALVSTTDESSGDCSYLDTCFKGRNCRFVHYKAVPPVQRVVQVPRITSTPIIAKPDETPPQWFCADILNLNLSALGSDFSAIIMDPPWDIHVNVSSAPNPDSIHDHIVGGLDVGSLQKNGLLFLWVTCRSIDVGHHCLETWGYTAIETIVWCKVNQLGRSICTGRTGHWLNHTKEHLLVGIKGTPKLTKGLDVDVIVSMVRGNPQKPTELYNIVDRLVENPSRKLELFGTPANVRKGWLTIGNELSGSHFEDAELEKRCRNATTQQLSQQLVA